MRDDRDWIGMVVVYRKSRSRVGRFGDQSQMESKREGGMKVDFFQELSRWEYCCPRLEKFKNRAQFLKM